MIKKPRECRVKQPKLGYGLHYVLIKPKWKAINFHLKNFLLRSLISYSSKQQLYKSLHWHHCPILASRYATGDELNEAWSEACAAITTIETDDQERSIIYFYGIFIILDSVFATDSINFPIMWIKFPRAVTGDVCFSGIAIIW